ncbi:MAG TPA: STAS domain-containing protein [Spirochaetota bacterium]|nr:STAS domain-containing protein [Spirochaetota bacterium]HOD13177.1 STAS domain-containing protein [Spirochaetota bacterium]HPG49016.1 STAS domain-containing protein [Spirochaetota bacterium]HPN12343.1 STAS domain-containing protein [Spirochaetota bacterium]HQL81515.1 STAS domain-containing protein [Spirochaetota bacterium]
MKIKTTIDDSIVILAIEGSLSSEEKINFEKEVNQYKDRQYSLVLDLSDVTFIDSASLGTIVKYYALFQKNGRHLLLSNMSKQIYEVFNLTGVTRQIRIFDTTRAAVDFIRGNS